MLQSPLSKLTAGPRRRKRRASTYYRPDADGRRRYEIIYLDSDGRRRWQVIDGGLEHAVAALEDVRSKVRRQERVAPTHETFATVAEAWLAAQAGLAPRTREAYRSAMRNHLLPHFGAMRVERVTPDDLARFFAAKKAVGYKGWTIRAMQTPLNATLAYAARRGLISANPVERLLRSERPKTDDAREGRSLDREEIDALLSAADRRRKTLLAAAVFTGLRESELVGLTWSDVDHKNEVIRLRYQLSRKGERVRLKTKHASRDVVLMPALAKLFTAERLRSPFSQEDDFVFAAGTGRAIGQDVAQRAFRRARDSAGLDPELDFHDLRRTFGSLLIARGEDGVFVAGQMGHANPSTTYRIYAKEFEAARHAAQARAALERDFGGMLGNGVETAG